MWILWAAFQVGVCVFFFFLRQAAPTSPAASGSWPWLLALGPLTISAGLRWIVMPRLRNPEHGLVCMVLGIAMAEAVTFFGLFLAPQYQREFFVLSFLGILQFMPFYARRFFPAEEPDSLRQPFAN